MTNINWTKCVAWVATSIAVCVAVYYTHSAWCLWAFLLPMEIID